MHLTDTHAHIYLPEFDAGRADMLQAAASKGIQKIYMPAIDSTTHAQMLSVEAQYSQCIAMMGLHPCSVNERYEEELALAESYLQQRPFAAVGEIGLDFYWDVTFKQQQYAAFEKQIEWALQYDLPIVIHSRNAIDECIEVVEQHKGSTGIFHCFSGTVEQARRMIDAGFLLGIGGVVTYKNAGLDKVVAAIGIEHVVLETDAPYLAPVPYRGKRNEPAYLDAVAEKLVALTGKPKEEIAAITTENAIKIFKLS
jgi:TatD DNase family protein